MYTSTENIILGQMNHSPYAIYTPFQCQTAATSFPSQAEWPFPHINEHWRGSIG